MEVLSEEIVSQVIPEYFGNILASLLLSSMSQIRMVWSLQAAAMYIPSGEYKMELIRPE